MQSENKKKKMKKRIKLKVKSEEEINKWKKLLGGPSISERQFI